MSPTSLQARYTKRELLKQLTAVETRLYSGRTERAVRKLSSAKKLEFLAMRLQWSAIVRQVRNEALRDMREALDEQTPSLRRGIGALQKSLRSVSKAATWARSVRGVLEALSKVVDVL